MHTPLPTTPLGRTPFHITRTGVGAWAIGGGGWRYAWGAQDDRDSIAAIHHAVARGINWIDTAPVYGLGHSEEVVAQALAELPAAERPFVFTKCGLVWDDAHPDADPQRIGHPESIRRECDASLRRLRVEALDLLQLHWPPNDVPVEEAWGALVRLRDDGKARAVGLSNHVAAQLEACEALGHVDTLQPQMSALRRKVTEAELPWCAAHGTGVIVYSPMQSGLLTGRMTRERAAALPADDWRSRTPEFQGEKLERNLRFIDAGLAPVAERHGVSIAAVAVAWTLAWPGVTGAIVGARSAAQVDGWLPAASLALEAEDLATIAGALEATGAGVGPLQPADSVA